MCCDYTTVIWRWGGESAPARRPAAAMNGCPTRQSQGVQVWQEKVSGIILLVLSGAIAERCFNDFRFGTVRALVIAYRG
jgi:hypothetical protein